MLFQRNCDSILVSPMREEELKDNAMVNIILYHHPTIHQLKRACFGKGLKKGISYGQVMIMIAYKVSLAIVVIIMIITITSIVIMMLIYD